jgi:hypothetical protein
MLIELKIFNNNKPFITYFKLVQRIINISLLILLAGWLTGYQAAEYSGSLDLNIPGISASQTDLSGSGDAAHREPAPAPFLPATLAETGHESIQEVEPDTSIQLAKLSGSTLLTYGADYLRYSERTERFDPVRKLLFPFHSYL